MQGKLRYKNISGQKLIVMGVGEVDADGIIESVTPIENPNLKLMTKDDRKVGVDPVTKSKK